MGQLVHSMKESSSRSFPSDTEKNPKDCMAITVRSGKEVRDGKELGNSKNDENRKVDNEKIVDEEVDNKKVENEKVEAEKQELQMDKKEEKREENKSTPRNILFPDKTFSIVPPFPFPQRFRKSKLDGKFATFFNFFKKLEVNIPVVSRILRVSGSSGHSPVTSRLQPAKQTRRRRWCSVVPPLEKLVFFRRLSIRTIVISIENVVPHLV